MLPLMSSFAEWTRSAETSPDALALVEAMLPDLWRRAGEADRWCRRALSPRELWSFELDPLLFDAEGAIPTSPPRADGVARVQELVQTRRALLDPDPSAAERPLTGGICWYLPQENCFDGAAELASDGLFNGQNVPGWDTWLALRALPPATAAQIASYVGDRGDRWILFAWIPGPFLAQAAEGIGNNPERCIGWLDDPHRSAARARRP